jgi:energy-coupling factor transporter ATP-binding protein EcfA2
MYELHSLGWYGFQELCNSIAREILGQTSMTFLDSSDGGRDGCFSGKWKNIDGQIYDGEFVIQCKFRTKGNGNLKFSDVSDEIDKAHALAEKGLCDIYILMTNAGVSAPMAGKIQTNLKAVGVKHVLVFGSTWINSQIKENSKLRRMVPRVYGLGDLTQILDARVYSQGAALLDYLKEDLAKVVITSTFNKAAEAIEKHSFVLLIGEPAAGKTTIASLLAMGALDQWKAVTLKLDKPEQVIKHWNPDDPGQFFWIDDAFGVTQYESALSNSWNHVMPQIKAMLNKGAKIVMTSRDYIYNAARKDLKGGVFPLLNESQVVIDVHNLTTNEKRQMLYNHIKMGKQSLAFRTEIKDYLEYIANLKRFIPETARRIADPFFTKNLYMSEYWIKEFVDKQESFLLDVITGLDTDSLAALGLIYMNNDKLKSPLNLKQIEQDALSRLGSSLNGCITALEAMNGNMVQRVSIDDEFIWKFRHPTISDAYASYIAATSELLEIYIHGSDVDKLLEQVTCGDVNLTKAVVLPKSLFSLILEKLKYYNRTSRHKTEFTAVWYAKKNLLDFLSRRCSENFLKLYVKKNPGILDQVTQLDLLSYSTPELDLAVALFRSQLFTENHRKTIVEKITESAITGDNLKVLDSEDIQEFFKESELSGLREKIKNELIPAISNLKDSWKARYHGYQDAEYHMMSLKDNLEIIENEFPEFPEIENKIKIELEAIDSWVVENTDIDEDITERESLGYLDNDDEEKERSIFDDIDV